jgi:hypothetical protein
MCVSSRGRFKDVKGYSRSQHHAGEAV